MISELFWIWVGGAIGCFVCEAILDGGNLPGRGEWRDSIVGCLLWPILGPCQIFRKRMR